MTRRRPPLVALALATLALLGCADRDAADAAPAAGEQRGVAEEADALAAAHDALRDHLAAVERGDLATAARRWDEVAATVDDAVATEASVEELDSSARSTLVGFRRGVRVARDAGAEVQALLDAADSPEAADAEAVEAAAEQAARRLDALGNLREGLERLRG